MPTAAKTCSRSIPISIPPNADLKASDQGLRVRVEKNTQNQDERVVITHKGPRLQGPLKSRPETEFKAADADAVTRLFAALGYEPVLTFEKRRRSWRYRDCQVVIDTLPYLGDFVEIEGPSETSVLSARKALGLDNDPLISTSYIAMLRRHLTQHEINTDYVRLDSAARAG